MTAVLGTDAAGPAGSADQQDLYSLISPFGVVSAVDGRISVRGLPGFTRAVAYASRLGRPHTPLIYGSGVAMNNPAHARKVAVAEAAERYSAADTERCPSEYVWSAARDLGMPTIDIERIPQCSPTEYSSPDCPLVPFDEMARIRWTRGVDLAAGIERWVPSVMAIVYLPRQVPGERFVLPISTGYAVHTDPHAALCAAICEIIERDINEILWQQQIPLPLVDTSLLTDVSRRIVSWYNEHFVRALLFDATSDIGVPAAYCLCIAKYDHRYMHYVSCSTGRTISLAAEKALAEGVCMRSSRGHGGTVKTDFREFTNVDDGMNYLGLAEHASAFSFLVDGCEDRETKAHLELPEKPEARLCWLIDTLAAKGMQVIAVDRTTLELTAAGLSAYCAIIPDLQPMSLRPLARYRGHPRLYAAPAAMGYRSLPESDLNNWPQPFA